MENIKFNYNHAKALIDAEKVDQVKEYVKQFFFRYHEKIFHFDGLVFTLYDREAAMKLIPSDFKITRMIANEHTKKYEKEEFTMKNYLRETDFMCKEYKPTIMFNEPRIFTKSIYNNGYHVEEHFLNMAKPMNYNLTTKPTRTTETDAGLKLVYDHINEVLCNKNKVLFEYVLNFISATFGGRKLRKAIIMQSAERTGKGQIINGLLHSILGQRMFKCNSTEQIMKYSKPFEGCCLLNFDEFPHCENYKGLQDILEGLITEPTFICRDMFSSGYEQTNTFNIIISSNNDSISLSQTNNSRYVVLDISEHRVGDIEYFNKLTKALNNCDVKRSFYEDMLNRFKSLDAWNEDIMPETETRNSKLIEGLCIFYKYIKEQFRLGRERQ